VYLYRGQHQLVCSVPKEERPQGRRVQVRAHSERARTCANEPDAGFPQPDNGAPGRLDPFACQQGERNKHCCRADGKCNERGQGEKCFSVHFCKGARSNQTNHFPLQVSAAHGQLCYARSMTARLFPALLKYWRGQRGFSQLDLALEASISARHLSFLESGRAKPSADMVLRLLTVLRVPLRDQNQVLRAAGFAAHFDEPSVQSLSPEINAAIDQMMAQHEPYPMTLVGLDGCIVRSNAAAPKIFGAFIAEPQHLPSPPDMISMAFDPRLMRPFVQEWPQLARMLVSRLHRERLERAEDERGVTSLTRALAFPGVPKEWQSPDFSSGSPPALTVRLERNGMRVGFLVAITTFSAPQQVTLEELRIESCFPLDDETRAVCARLAAR
jgi:transcriptional regulator with XRE-family HTH domain